MVARVHYRAVSIYHVSLHAQFPKNASAELPSNLVFAGVHFYGKDDVYSALAAHILIT